LAQTARHFFPAFNDWIDQIHDPRFLPLVTYDKRFLLWDGLLLFATKLGSRRQLDYNLNTDGPQVLANLNRLAATQQDSCPVNKTLECFLGGIGAEAVATLRHKAVGRLIRMKVLDGVRVRGRYLILIDGSGYLVFNHKHCVHCLRQQHGNTTLYMHQVLEAKLLGPGGTVFSIATEFIDNRDVADLPADASVERVKQDCELKALGRLLPKLRRDFPQLRICLCGDGLYCCGAGFQLAKDYRCDFIHVFQPGRIPTLWEDFQSLLSLCPQQRVEWTTPDQTRQVYRWAPLEYVDSDKRPWKFTGIICEQTTTDGQTSQWSWVTSLEVNHRSVVEVALRGGRERWRAENEGFNTQKNSGLNLEHAFSHTNWAAYYYLLQIAHLLLQLVEKGSLLLRLAQEHSKPTAVEFFGSLKNLARRLLESLRYLRWPESAFDVDAARKIQIRLNDSS
jgi:hypothetical protein